MKKDKGIDDKYQESPLQKTLLYINNIELYLHEIDTATPVLAKVFKQADTDLKAEIIFLLGIAARKKVVWMLYTIMADSHEEESTRRIAANQISVTAAGLDKNDDLAARLIEDIEGPDLLLRGLAAIVLGGGEGQ